MGAINGPHQVVVPDHLQKEKMGDMYFREAKHATYPVTRYVSPIFPVGCTVSEKKTHSLAMTT